MTSLVCSSVFITGCNRGLGLGFVKHLLNLPIAPKHIFATCRSLKAESALELRQLGDKHSNLHLMELDVGDFTASSQLHEVVENVEALLADSGLNLLINNAGIIFRETFNDVTVESMKSSYEVNTIAPLMITKAFHPLLKRAASAKEPSSEPQSAIINISTNLASIHNDGGRRNNLPYRTSKAALNMVTKSLSIELYKDGILVVAVHPGWVQTDMGGKDAAITIDDSISSMLKLFGSLDKSKSGCFLSYDGSTIPW